MHVGGGDATFAPAFSLAERSKGEGALRATK
jgi:hypothetical protein